MCLGVGPAHSTLLTDCVSLQAFLISLCFSFLIFKNGAMTTYLQRYRDNRDNVNESEQCLPSGGFRTSEASYSYLTACQTCVLLCIPGSNPGSGSANVELMSKGQGANLQTPGKIIHQIPCSIIYLKCIVTS